MSELNIYQMAIVFLTIFDNSFIIKYVLK